jgi:peptide/nickel transport system permease protein
MKSQSVATTDADAVVISYGSMVWARLRRNRVATFGLYCIAVLFAFAVAAPLLASSQPFFWSTNEGLQFPWFRALFNRLVFENSVDVLFNLLLLVSVVVAPCVLLAPRRLKLALRQRWGFWLNTVCAAVAILFLLVAPERWLVVNNPLYMTARTENYLELAAKAQAAGERVSLVFAPVHFSYSETNPSGNLQPPSLTHWFGTDTTGRDVFARMLFGTRVSLTIGVVAVAIYVSIGTLLGALAGFFGGRLDLWISRLVEVMICFPSFFLILTIAALIEQRSIFHVMLIIGLTSWTGVARLVRAEFLKNINLDYVQAARALGLRQSRIIFRHVLPNAIAPVLISATFGVASAILVESSLAFLGVGDASVASWGEILNAGRAEGKLWLVLAPGVAIFFVVSIINLVGEGLRDALDPKLDG